MLQTLLVLQTLFESTVAQCLRVKTQNEVVLSYNPKVLGLLPLSKTHKLPIVPVNTQEVMIMTGRD